MKRQRWKRLTVDMGVGVAEKPCTSADGVGVDLDHGRSCERIAKTTAGASRAPSVTTGL